MGLDGTAHAPGAEAEKHNIDCIATTLGLKEIILERYQAAGNSKTLERFRRMTPVAWRYIHFLGRYQFKAQHHPVDLKALLAGVELA
jgi:hypothetical protein